MKTECGIYGADLILTAQDDMKSETTKNTME